MASLSDLDMKIEDIDDEINELYTEIEDSDDHDEVYAFQEAIDTLLCDKADLMDERQAYFA